MIHQILTLLTQVKELTDLTINLYKCLLNDSDLEPFVIERKNL